MKGVVNRRFRLVRWDQYRRHFASTREHMRDGEGGWYAPPPPWPCFVAAGVAQESADMRVCSTAHVVGSGRQHCCVEMQLCLFVGASAVPAVAQPQSAAVLLLRYRDTANSALPPYRTHRCMATKPSSAPHAADGGRHNLPRYWDMSDPVVGPAWPDAEPFGLVYKEADFLSLLGVQTVGEAAAEHTAQTIAERGAVLALA